ncbi:uncharacterized protein BDZ83DRAFT_755673 [Colletotrichum acutatum]|uniref:Uncharacterized protein n=1 Tax=Glomerella acutata TaxID=27357 RepID=A0AAD8XDP7_GLOAC|nr:uncharacterized protein BDZ83DRAFT_755673 [Colletotrichum acutatum]KAK1717481.1 hypothetical protein BDZ83DRAFT_755673 [Colletotrichum acutatum]
MATVTGVVGLVCKFRFRLPLNRYQKGLRDDKLFINRYLAQIVALEKKKVESESREATTVQKNHRLRMLRDATVIHKNDIAWQLEDKRVIYQLYDAIEDSHREW